jgi:ATP phosphoribosyltransferase
MKSNEQITQLLAPGGEWLPYWLMAMKEVGIELTQENKRVYRLDKVNQAIPLIFDVIRSKDIPETINDIDSLAKGGFTGSDITSDQDIDPAWAFELVAQMFSPEESPEVYLGLTPNTRGAGKKIIQTLTSGCIYTPYPNLARKWLQNELGIANLKIKEKAGKIEGFWRFDPTCKAIIDISSTGKTLEANRIRKVRTIMTPELVFVRSPNMSTQDRLRCDDMREKVYLQTRRSTI